MPRPPFNELLDILGEPQRFPNGTVFTTADEPDEEFSIISYHDPYTGPYEYNSKPYYMFSDDQWDEITAVHDDDTFYELVHLPDDT